MWRKRGTPFGRQLGLLFWFATLVFANFTIWNNSTQWNPPWIGFGLHVLASWYVCWRLVPGWGWAVVPLWWTACVVLHLVAQHEHEWMLWLIGVVLYRLLVSRNAALIGIAEKYAQERYRPATNS
jgi:hypothetical protein